MTTLYIFGDESGTMPINDNDKPFVAATVGFLGKIPDAVSGTDENKKLAETFKNLHCIPFVAIVKPFPGYGNKLKSKHNKMQTMARATRLITGANTQYLDSNGINIRNFVWAHAMQQAIVHAVTGTMLSDRINYIHIILDELSMNKSTRNLFTTQLYRMPNTMKEVLKRGRQIDPIKISKYEDRIQFSAESTIIQWSDKLNESEKLKAKFGLKLADRFARKIYQQLENNDQTTGIEFVLRSVGFKDFMFDITDVVTRPPNPKSVADWKQNTGLPVPKEY